MASSLLSEPLKNYAERQASERLPNFDITIGTLHVQPFRLGMGVEDVHVRLLEAYGHIDAKQGTFAFFSDMRVKNNRIEGYVKPFLKDVQIYDPEHDGLLKLLNRKKRAV